MSRKNDGINETILGWFKRVHPEELWAVKEMPPTGTFKDMEKSMAAGQGMGEAFLHKLGIVRIPADKVTLHPFLLGQRFQRAADRAILRKNGVTDTKKPDAQK